MANVLFIGKYFYFNDFEKNISLAAIKFAIAMRNVKRKKDKKSILALQVLKY